MFNFDEANKKGKEAMDTALKSYSDVTKGFQAIAAEAAEYSKKSFQDGVAHFETLAGVKSFEAAFELQSSYVKSSYENFVAEATKLGEMYADLAKNAYKPYEAPVAAATKAASKAAATATAA
ncbi:MULTISPECIES: phasin family protein [Rhizobium]|jgi:phasin family protein|uniref:Phasin family protein n=3 Tax=Rhizobium TaxID=379 RepID=A0A1C3WNK8_9HYPH|nr:MULTISPECIES: phasin family protein [Rhizobium]MBB3386039.1 phasin family protein [Rhizobium sp. BK098]MBB3427832.1 phasin family protein [Rhizobium sp. BK312]MBB3566106.1 phasin family protein [Rhizobium sp. BK491]MBB3617784.1 phasin family protein [Rhizobium sp. BK609]MBB3683401.1 phasin family protein [Rhizobium sp. BK612]